MNLLLSRLSNVRRVGLLWAMLAAVASLATGPAVLAAEPETHTGHGWFVLPPETEKDNIWAVYHVPPRRIDGANAGAVQLGSVMTKRPTHIAAVRSRIYVVLQPEASPDVRQRRVLTMRAERGISGMWEMNPPDRLMAIPSLPADPDLVSFVGSPHGPIALLRDTKAEDPAKAWMMKVYAADAWRDVELPAAIAEKTVACGVSYPWGVGLVTMGGAEGEGKEGVTLWSAVLPSREEIAALEQRPISGVKWASSTLSIPAAWKGVTRGIEFIGVDGQVVALRREQGEGANAVTGAVASRAKTPLEIYLLRAGECVRVARFDDVPMDAMARALQGAGSSLSTLMPGQTEPDEQPILGGGRLVLTWEVPTTDAPSRRDTLMPAPQPRNVQVREIALDGQVLYSGGGRLTGPISKRELEMLVMVLMGVMVCVVFFVLREEKPGVTLPSGLLVSTVSRRVFATMIDLVPAAVLAAMFNEVSVASIFDPMTVLEQGYGPILTAVLLAWGHTTLSEWLTGTTMGKSMTGSGVISLVELTKDNNAPESPAPDEGGEAGRPVPAEPVLMKPSLPQAMLRNAVKWALPVLGVTMLFDSMRRHPGDLIAKTIVVMRDESEDDEAE